MSQQQQQAEAAEATEAVPATERQDALCAFVKPKGRRPAGLRKREEAPPDITQAMAYPERNQKRASSSSTNDDDEVDSKALVLHRSAAPAKAKVQQQSEEQEAPTTNTTKAAPAPVAPAAPAAKKTRTGPVKAPAHVRTTSVMDYQPEIRKDYAETGYCGFGDSCKFLHDRGDYKSGWQIEKEWEEQQSARAAAALGTQALTHARRARRRNVVAEEDALLAAEAQDDGEAHDDDDDVPFACLRCRRKWGGQMKPVRTRCAHVFCEQCLVQWFKRHGVCPYCKADCGKFYSTPPELLARIQQLREEAALAATEDAQHGATDRQDVRVGRHRSP